MSKIANHIQHVLKNDHTPRTLLATPSKSPATMIWFSGLVLGIGFPLLCSGLQKSSDHYGSTFSVSCPSSSSSCQLIPGRLPSTSSDSHAYGTYLDTIDKDGWGKLWVHGDATPDGWYQAGFLEGALTSERTYQHYISWYNYQFGSSPPTEQTLQYLLDQYRFALQLSSLNTDPYHVTLAHIMKQFHGILDGINYSAKDNQTMSLTDLLLLEAAGDLYDIIPAVNPELFDLRLDDTSISAAEFFDRWHTKVSCSALIKITDDLSDVYAAHTTWTSYQNMLRIYKHYALDGGNYRSSHSSKPGVIYSKDDFYVLPNHHLIVMETTNGVMNEKLYDAVTTHSLLTWQRLPLCNTLATSGKEWVDLVSKYNSGTYANQWMILDLKHFTPGVGVTSSSDFLWIIELAPGLAISKDVTSVMMEQGGYWPSYNIPYTPEMYALSGFQKAYETYGKEYSYKECSRAQIFQRNQSMIQSFGAMKRMLRDNHYLTDPLSEGNAALAISARYDLRASSPKTYGGVDTKATSFTRVMADESGEDMKVLLLFSVSILLTPIVGIRLC
jgi:hypothetical protein